MTPREAAKDLIRGYVERGDSIESLAKGYLGYCGDNYKAHIGGWMWREENLSKPDGKPFKHLNSYQIGVEQIGEIKVMEVFSLKEIYNEILVEKRTGRKEQMTLF